MEKKFEELFAVVKAAFSKLTKGTYSLDQILQGNSIWDALNFQSKGVIGHMIEAAVKDGKIPGITLGGKDKAGDREYKVD